MSSRHAIGTYQTHFSGSDFGQSVKSMEAACKSPQQYMLWEKIGKNTKHSSVLEARLKSEIENCTKCSILTMSTCVWLKGGCRWQHFFEARLTGYPHRY
jgi:hypothetical protein